ncbi:MAG TPA: response regulator transcription factor, partial [Chloroflexota bacterium]|nr:response regulator transcription factor [Chloroflexota bacterium]
DDYLTKPFSMHELLARVRALVRRADMTEPPMESPPQLTSGDLVVETALRRATLRGVLLRLKPREFELLSYLMQHPNQIHSRERLLLHVWGYEFAGDTRTVDVHIRWLRGKIEPDATNPTRIQTVRGAGYVFAG